MGLSTHVLDTMHGCPAAGMRVELFRLEGAAPTLLCSASLDADGRVPGGLLGANVWSTGRYRLSFDVQGYFQGRGVALPEPAFLGVVPLDFGVADAAAHYHVPLLVSPWSYSTYRGS